MRSRNRVAREAPELADTASFFCRSRAYTPGVVHPAGGNVDCPSGRAPPVGSGVDSPRTALRPAHRLPTPLPTGSTLNPHSHRHTQHHQVEFLIFRERKAVRSDIVPHRQNTRKRTPIRSLERAFFFSFVFNGLLGGGSAPAMHYPPCTSYALPLVHFCVVFTQVYGKDKLCFQARVRNV